MVHDKAHMFFDQERFSWNTAWVKKGGQRFEVVIDPDKALEFKRTKGATDIKECLHAERIFTDAKRGEHAKDIQLKEVFGIDDQLAIAKILLLEGEIQFTAEHREKLREMKHKQIISKICTYAVDPKTGTPHPEQRIRLAMEEAKVKIDDNKDVDQQFQVIVKQLRTVLPIRLETITLQIHLPAPYGQKLHTEIQRYGTIKKNDWLEDGGWLGWLEMPAGLQNDLYDELGKKTHGVAIIKKVGEQQLT